jgi:cytochrome P450
MVDNNFGQLQHRVAWGHECRNDSFSVASNRGRLWIVNPYLANELLSASDGGAGLLIKADFSKKRMSLLSHSLTQADGVDWNRQRPAVLAAIGGGIAVSANRHKQAARQAAELALELIDSDCLDDVMDIALRVAARGIVAAVAGSTEEITSKARKLEEILVSFQKYSRRNQHVNIELVASLEEDLRHSVEDLVEHYVQKMSSGSSEDEFTALLCRLLNQKALSRQEVTANTHSCLLAGVETTSLLIGAALLRLCSRPTLRDAARDEILTIASTPGQKRRSRLVGAIMTETLRVHPPVTSRWERPSQCACCRPQRRQEKE